MDESYIVIPRHIVGNLALGAIALHELGLSEEEAADLLDKLASNEEILTGIADFIEDLSIGSFDIHTLMQEANLG